MKRSDIEKAYDVQDGVIKSPGKFEGEPVYVPYFWDAALQGMYAEDVAGVFFIPFDKDDYLMFPELGSSYGIGLEESEQGFVYAEVFDDQKEYNAAVESCEKLDAETEELS